MTPQIQNLEPMLKESVKHFLMSYHSGSSDFSSFESIFFRLIQTMLDPPLEISWFYSAVTFHAAKPAPQNDPSARVLRVKDLLKLLISCSNLSRASKKIALLAPVVCELYNVVRDCRKAGPFVEMEVKNVVDNIVNYVMISAGVHAYGEGDNEIDNVVVCFEELVGVWVADRGGGTRSFMDILKVFFPLLTDETRKVINATCSLRELVGIVLCEVFLLRLYLTLSSGMQSEDKLKDAQKQVAESIKGFQNCYFLDMLFKMLLETSLPISDLLRSEDVVLLHKVLYDAVMLSDYSFYSDYLVQLPDSHSKRFALVWVLVADRASQFARTTSDEARTVSYLNAFCKSRLVAELTRWASIQAETLNQNTRPVISTPNSLIKWLLLLEAQGIRVFDHSISAMTCMSETDSKSLQLFHRKNHHDQNSISYHEPDANKDQEMADPGSGCWMNTKNDMGRKRKESLNGLHEFPVKQIKFSQFSTNNRLSCGVEVKTVASDEDMELIG